MSRNEEVLNKLSNDSVREALLEIIHNNVPTNEYSLELEDGSSKGDNYVGIVQRLTVTYETEPKNDDGSMSKPKQLRIFIKVPPENIQRRNQFFARPCFLKESLMYDEFLPLIAEFQRSKGIDPERDGFNEHAKCYKTITEDLREAIFMEDLSVKGYRMNDRFVEPSLEMVKLIMQALGKFHALSFALKEECPEKFKKFRGIAEIFQRNDELFVDYINSLGNLACQAVSNEGDAEYLEILKDFLEKNSLCELLRELTDGSKAEPYAVVCHGDSWNNNILFKFENDTAVDIKLIDWQLSRFASPVCDLAYYIFSCTTKSFRDKYYEEILNVYYSELSKFLKRLGFDPSKLFPRSAFEEQLNKFSKIGLILGLMVIPIITTKPEDVMDLDDVSAKMEAGDKELTKQAFGHIPADGLSRIRGVVIDLIKLNYIFIKGFLEVKQKSSK